MSGDEILPIQCMATFIRIILTYHLSYHKVCVIDYFPYLHICICLFIVLFKWFFNRESNLLHYITNSCEQTGFSRSKKNLVCLSDYMQDDKKLGMKNAISKEEGYPY